jgi:hypothetical protein
MGKFCTFPLMPASRKREGAARHLALVFVFTVISLATSVGSQFPSTPLPAPTQSCLSKSKNVAGFQLWRPFFGGDVNELIGSFARWELFPPCTLDGNREPTTPGLPVPLVLYFARDVDDAAYVDMKTKLEPIIHNNETDCAAVPNWQKCFTSITLLGANLTASQDQYHTRMDDPSWNRGPNVQFYRAVRFINEQPAPSSKVFYYMEGDSIPLAHNWLDGIATEIYSKSPFSVLGGRYAGHNWDPFPGDDVIVPSLRNHLNGNGIYNVEHTLLQLALHSARFGAHICTRGCYWITRTCKLA